MRRFLLLLVLITPWWAGCQPRAADDHYGMRRTGERHLDECAYGNGCTHERADPDCNAYPFCLSAQE